MTIHEREDDEREDEDPRLAIVKNHVAGLAEHFEAVQVLVTRQNPDTSTTSYSWGAGNWYARYGQMKAWVTREEETLRREMRTADDE